MNWFHDWFGTGEYGSLREALDNAPVTHYGTANFMRGHGQHKPHLWFADGLWHSIYCGSIGLGQSPGTAYCHAVYRVENAPL